MIDYMEKHQHHHQPEHHRFQGHQMQAMVSSGNQHNNNNNRGAIGQQSSTGAQQHALLAMQTQTQQPAPLVQLVEVLPERPIQQQQTQQGNELIGYYFGSIARETAEWILKTHGNHMDGAYLLRSSGPNDDFVLSLMVVHQCPQGVVQSSGGQQELQTSNSSSITNGLEEVLHYKIIETEDSFVALHGQVGDEKFSTIDELIDKAQGVATKPRWPIHRQTLEYQILPPTYWGLTVDQIRLAILLKAKQWGFPLLSSLFQAPQQQQEQNSSSPFLPAPQQQQSTANGLNCQPNNNNNGNGVNATTLNNETIRTLIYKSLHEFQPWFHGKISREEAERRIEDGGGLKDGRFLVRERDNYSYAMCISHKRTTKHYRIDVLPTGELAIQDGRKFTSLMALVSHYTIMSDGLWCALTEACPRPIQLAKNPTGANSNSGQIMPVPGPKNTRELVNSTLLNQNIYCVPPISMQQYNNSAQNMILPAAGLFTINQQITSHEIRNGPKSDGAAYMTTPSANQGATTHQSSSTTSSSAQNHHLICAHQSGVTSIKAPIKEWLQTINHKWTQLMASRNQHQSLNSFLFGNQNPLNNHCRHGSHQHHHRHHHHHQLGHRRKCKNGHTACGCIQEQLTLIGATSATANQRNDTELAALSHRCSVPQSSLKGDQKDLALKQVAGQQQQVACQCNPSATLATALLPQHLSAYAQKNNLLTYSSQNSGFALSSQSFVGSPLFAVKPSTLATTRTDRNQVLENMSQSGSSSSGGGGGGARSIGQGNGAVKEEKLISPAQSISAINLNESNLNNTNNNPYSLDTGIYGSQTSTALINDPVLTNSSSSSSGGAVNHRLLQQPTQYGNNNKTAPLNGYGEKGNSLAQQQQQQQTASAHYGATMSGPSAKLMKNDQLSAAAEAPAAAASGGGHPAQLAPVTASGTITATMAHTCAGPILCGQHAGPAYRYTNCNDENSFKPCYHRSALSAYNHQRAADDSQLITPSTQLAGPAAMTKFVQFQDGQCLRTHRDTRSIQMAYLSSRQQQLSSSAYQVGAQNGGAGAVTCNSAQVPLREQQQPKATAASAHQHSAYTMHRSNNIPVELNAFTRQAGYQQRDNVSLLAQQQNCGSFKAASQQHQMHGNNNHHQLLLLQQQQQQQRPQQRLIQANASQIDLTRNNANEFSYIKEIDLMDCGEDEEGFHFKYDPKLIKSSSIETLCGVNGVDELEELACSASNKENNLSATCKSNTELMMSLQTCWLAANAASQQSDPNILSPIPAQTSSMLNNSQVTLGAGSSSKGDGSEQLSLSLNGANDNQFINGRQDDSVLSSLITAERSENEQLDHMRKKHDLDELTTALLAELTASLKAQVDLKNKRSGFGSLYNTEKGADSQQQQRAAHQAAHQVKVATSTNSSNPATTSERSFDQASEARNPIELINEFDTLIPNNNR